MNATASRELECRKNFMRVLRVAKFASEPEKIALSCCYYNEFTTCIEGSLIDTGDRCSARSFDYYRELSNRFKANTMDLLCGAKYAKHSERCDDIIGGQITGKDIIVKY